MHTIRAVAVVVPARNEERRLPACLAALAQSRHRLTRAHPGIHVVTVVVLDRCVDDSAAIIRGWPGVLRVDSVAGQVGAARDLGVQVAMRRLGDRGGAAPTQTWIACTDADSIVPPTWLTDQVSLAKDGADLMLGTVSPREDELHDSALTAWHQQHRAQEGHPYVHGANLGIRADIYQRAGGFPAVSQHEDVLLAESARAAGARVVSTARCPVVTSARRHGRTPGGFAGYLRRMDGQLSEPDITVPATA